MFGAPLADLLHEASLVKLGRDAVRRPVLNGALTVSTAKFGPRHAALRFL
jgi:hypothetical protein